MDKSSKKAEKYKISTFMLSLYAIAIPMGMLMCFIPRPIDGLREVLLLLISTFSIGVQAINVGHAMKYFDMKYPND
jgi:hypothetical protein